ncbi:hypothetical protein JTB14_001690 [Gonioctena quinquepunctata]|nr:hypothetical protein JTB14_001690 [Gonioctena quinquepunctata]
MFYELLPAPGALWSSLIKLGNFIQEHNIQKLAIPRLGCGLDKLRWKQVKNMIYSIFQNIDIDILVCSLPLEDNQQTRETTVHENEEISRRENEQPIICTNTTNTAYKGMSIGWLEEWTGIPVDNAIVLYGTSIEEEEVTIEDHQIKHITDEIFKRSLSNLFEEYKDVFSKSVKRMGLTNLAEHKIDVGDALRTEDNR